MEQARLAAGWLKQKYKLLPVLIILTLVGTTIVPAFLPRTYAINRVDTGGGFGANWNNANHTSLTYNGTKYTGQPKNNALYKGPQDANGCGPRITFKGDPKAATSATFINNSTYYGPSAAAQCKDTSSQSISISPDSATDSSATGNATPNNKNSTDGETACDAGGALSWFVCPMIELLNNGIIQMQNTIDNLLQVNVGDVFNTAKDPGKSYFAAWNSFRVFAVILIVIAGLVMVISQALGFDMFDAYTVKKVLPRLFVAAIGISLSWYLLKFLAEFTNDLGMGIRGLIYYPFRNMGSAGLQNPGSYIITTILAGGALWALTIGGVLSLVATAGLAALVAFLVLILRQLVIIFLILMAPLAIACYVLPNTEKIYKLWWDSLFKGMLMFPIISAFIAVGRVFSVVSSNTSSGAGSSVNQVIAFIAFFLPYFALPFTFRMAGGAMATLGGMVNDRSRGGFDRLKKYRGDKMSQSWQDTKDGTRFNNRALNTMTARATTSRLGFGKRGRAAYEQKMDLAGHHFAKTEQAAGVQFNDPVLQAMSYGSAVEARARMGQDFDMNSHEVSEAIAGVRAAGGFGKARQVWAAKQLAATGTGYEDAAQMYSTIARASGGNVELAQSMFGEMRGTSERAGRSDLKASYGAGSKAIADIMASGSRGTEEIRNNFGDRFTELGIDAARGADNMAIMQRNKPKSIRNMMRSLEAGQQRYQGILNSSGATAAQKEDARTKLGQIRAKMENLQNYKSYGPEVNSEAVHGMRTIAVTERDARGNPTQVTTNRDAGVNRSSEFISRAQEEAARTRRPDDPPTSASTAYQEEMSGRPSEEMIRRQTADQPQQDNQDQS